MRKPGAVLASNYDWNNEKVVLFDDSLIIDLLENDKNILVETSQGFDLDINHGLDYPHITSRGCTVMQALADCGIPHSANIVSYMVFRPYPIRISNETDMGIMYSGNYGDSMELMPTDIEQMSGCDNLTEYTTVTKRKRRFFEFEPVRFYHAVVLNQPNYLILNFAQQLDKRVQNMSDIIDLEQCYLEDTNIIQNVGRNPVLEFKKAIENDYGIPIAYIGTGPKDNEVVDCYEDIYAASYFGCRTMQDEDTTYTYKQRRK
jgi:adenylosuccinate synthase